MIVELGHGRVHIGGAEFTSVEGDRSADHGGDDNHIVAIHTYCVSLVSICAVKAAARHCSYYTRNLLFRCEKAGQGSRRAIVGSEADTKLRSMESMTS